MSEMKKKSEYLVEVNNLKQYLLKLEMEES